MSLKSFFDKWSSSAKTAYAERQWLLSKWEVCEGVRWPAEKIEAMADTVASGLRLDPGHIFLDMGCGGGWITECLRQRVRRTIGLDFSSHMLSVAASFGSGPWIQGDIGALPLRAESVDRVLSYFVFLNFIEDAFVERALLEAVRVLKHGGVALIGQLPDAAASDAYDQAKKEYLDDCCRLGMSLGARNDQDSRAPLRLFDRERLGRFLHSAGIRYECLPSFNPFYRSEQPVTINWRFDLVLFKD